MSKKQNWKTLMLVFVFHFICAGIALLPAAFANGGILTLCEDFNAETIPYYYLANHSVRSGEFSWNWNIDIGADFWTTYGSLGMFSPFFLIALLIPADWIPYSTVWILIMKYATAGLTSYLYIHRYVKKKECAVAGSMLYAFSGYQSVNLVFNLFDATMFFPLMLWALDELVLKKRRGIFALAVWINACVSFSMFVQSAILAIIYFIIRFWMNDRSTWKHIGVCMLEGIIGAGMAGIVFVPQALAMLKDTRAGVKLPGSSALTLSSLDVLLTLRAWLFPAEAMSNSSSVVLVDWMSNAGYLPMTGVAFALAFGQRNKKHWLTRCMLLSFVFMFVPALNNLFTLFGIGLYRRWYYFPVLMSSLATVRCFEDEQTEYPVFKSSLWILGLIAAYVLFVLYVPWSGTDPLVMVDQERFNWGVSVSVIGLIAGMVIWRFGKRADRGVYAVLGITLFAVLTTSNMVKNYQIESAHGVGKDGSNDSQAVINELFLTDDLLTDKDIWPYRTVYWNNYYNYNMIEGYPMRQSFVSVVPSGVNEFYTMLGTPRSTAMTPYGPSGTDELLSTKYFFLNYEPNSSLVKVAEQHNGNYMVYLYENTNVLPLGFTYDCYMTRSEFLEYPVEQRAAVMLRVLVVKDEDADKVNSCMDHYDQTIHGEFSVDQINQYEDDHLLEAGRNHAKERDGSFTLDLTASAKKYAFFSVPYTENWQASVNGENVEILNINGLMAIPVQAGENRIEFDYTARERLLGIAASLLFVGVWIAYFLWNRRRIRKERG